MIDPMTERDVPTIDYYVWLLSDWAYLGGFRFLQIAARHGIRVNHILMRMQDVFAGSGGIVLADRSWQRQAYRIQELKRWRVRLGMPLNIEPRYFPADVDLASRMVIAGQKRGLPIGDFANAVMRGIWAEDRNPADPAVLAAIAEGCGINGRALIEAAGAEAVEAEYRGNTARALAAGVFGSPCYLFDGQLFWGQDRLGMLEEAIIGACSGDLGRTPDGASRSP
jgi:2-hydroxychromene-2-carboxylate isomerase